MSLASALSVTEAVTSVMKRTRGASAAAKNGANGNDWDAGNNLGAEVSAMRQPGAALILPHQAIECGHRPAS
jgi:hypothetical protein